MRLKDKVALVTGACSGIGKAFATRFAAEEAHVVVNYRPGSEVDSKSGTSRSNIVWVILDRSQGSCCYGGRRFSH